MKTSQAVLIAAVVTAKGQQICRSIKEVLALVRPELEHYFALIRKQTPSQKKVVIAFKEDAQGNVSVLAWPPVNPGKKGNIVAALQGKLSIYFQRGGRTFQHTTKDKLVIKGLLDKGSNATADNFKTVCHKGGITPPAI